MKLKPVDHVGDTNAYCGPSVISAITGMKSGEAARLLRSITGKGSIKGSSEWAVVKALKACGLRVVGQNIAGPGAGLPTVAAWLKATHGKRGPNIWLLVAGNHWQAIQGNRYVCGLTKEVVPFDHPKIKRRAKVRAPRRRSPSLRPSGPITSASTETTAACGGANERRTL